MAEVLFGGVNVDAFFEYDNDRWISRRCALFVRHQQVVLGLITTKTASWRIRRVKRVSPRRSMCRSSRSASARSAVSPPLKGMPSAKTSMAKVRLVTSIAADVWCHPLATIAHLRRIPLFHPAPFALSPLVSC